MFPWGHAAVAYLLLAGARRRSGLRLTGTAVLAVLVASQLPDLIDKPLSWKLSLLPTGRTLAHSLVTGSMLLLVLLGLLAIAGLGRDVLLPVAIGWLSHSLTDALSPILEGAPQDLGYLGWPILPVLEYDGPENLVGIFARADPLSPFFLLQVGLVLLAVAVWWSDGQPGLQPTRDWVARRLGRTSETG